MEAQSLYRVAIPVCLNLGSGKDFLEDHLNIDVDDTWSPDAVRDLSAVTDVKGGIRLNTSRFGAITLLPGCFDKIVANDVIEHVPDLRAMMTTCLELLRVGGLFQISVPYDLSFGAWQDPTHIRAFNERSWLYFTDWFWTMGWSEFRFAVESFDFLPSALGQDLRTRGVPRDEILRTARAVDSMFVKLRKVALTPRDRETLRERHARRGVGRRQPATGDATNLVPTSMQAIVPVQSIKPVETEGLKAFDVDFASSRERYCIWIVTPPNYTHHQAYDDVAAGLSEAFATLGGSAPIIRDPGDSAGRTMIVLGPQLLPSNAATLLPPDTILFNLEQVDGTSPWMNGPYLSLLRQRPVLEYSIRNKAALAEVGVDHARLLPIGYARGLTRIDRTVEKTIDVLFYGSLNERRQRLLDALKQRGVNVVHLYDVYADARDAAIARAKIVLNVHFYETAIFESVRVSFLLSNGTCVLSEGDPADPDIAPFVGGIAIERYDDMVERCMALLADPIRRQTLADVGMRLIKGRKQSALLRALFKA